MTGKVLISIGSTVTALLAMGSGVSTYQRSQKERQEAQQATIAAMGFFDRTIEKVKLSLQQSSALRDDLIVKTTELFKGAATTERELVEHGARARELMKRRDAVSTEAARLLAEAQSSLGEATAAVGRCRKIVLDDKLKSEDAERLEIDIRGKAAVVQDVRQRMAQLDILGTRCEALGGSLSLYVEQNKASLTRIQEIKTEAQATLEAQKARATQAREASEKLKRLQAELKDDLESIRPAN